jgi:hypothetical protein
MYDQISCGCRKIYVSPCASWPNFAIDVGYACASWVQLHLSPPVQYLPSCAAVQGNDSPSTPVELSILTMPERHAPVKLSLLTMPKHCKSAFVYATELLID